jgi:flavorubredoxin
MKGPFKAFKITDRVYWVGAIDWGIRNFHGYATHMGTTYNAYLVMAEKITLMDTVKAPFRDELISRISSVIDPEKIDIIISNHSEMDHSGCLFDIVDLVKPEKVYLSQMGEKAVKAHFHRDDVLQVVKNGDKISLDNMEVHFMETRMLHWPDSMFSYIPEEKMLISQDGFGMHLASYERFDDEIPEHLLRQEASKYYANIILPYSKMVLATLKKAADMNLDIRYIVPDHGPVWRKDPGKILGWYEKWAKQEPENKAVIVYDTMWHSSGVMARSVAEGLAAGGTKVKVLPLEGNHRSDVATEILDAGALIVGSPTLNGNIFPTLADVLTYLRGLKPANKIGAVFSSYGWADASAGQLREYLEQMSAEVVDEIKINYVPTPEDLDRCFEMGKKVSDRLSRVTVQ